MNTSSRLLARANAALQRHIVANFRWQPLGELHTRVKVQEKVVALTFDDGPLPPYTDQLLEALADLAVRATFFFLGERVLLHRDAAKRVVAAGHEVGNHSYSHPRMYYKSLGYMRDQIEATDRLLREIGVGGDIPFRAPYGESLLGLPWLLWRMRRPHVLFDFFPVPPDWLGTPPEQVAGSIAAQAQPGSIIVLHDGNPRAGAHVAATVRLLVPALRERGYRFCAAGELIRRGRR